MTTLAAAALILLAVGLFVGLMVSSARVLREPPGNRDEPSPRAGSRGEKEDFSATAVDVLKGRLEADLPGLTWELGGEDRDRFEVPAVNPELGPLRLWIRDSDYVVALGDLFHQHFDPGTLASPPDTFPERQRRAAQEAVDLTRDILDQKTVFRVTSRNDAIVSVRSFSRDDTGGRADTLYPLTFAGLWASILGGRRVVRELSWSRRLEP